MAPLREGIYGRVGQTTAMATTTVNEAVFPKHQKPRRTLVLNVGNLLEHAGVALGCYAVDRLVGLAWALVCGAICLVVAAELIYDGSRVQVALPRIPRWRPRATFRIPAAPPWVQRVVRWRPHVPRRITRASLTVSWRLWRATHF